MVIECKKNDDYNHYAMGYCSFTPPSSDNYDAINDDYAMDGL